MKKDIWLKPGKELNTGAIIGGIGFAIYIALSALEWRGLALFAALAFGLEAGYAFLSALDCREKDKDSVSYNIVWGTGALAILMLLPAVILLLIFNYVPMGGIVMAFQDYRVTKGLFKSEWVGLDNFRFLMSYPDFWKDLEALGGNHREEYPDYLGQCASLDKNLGRLVNKLKEMGIYEDTVIIYLADHGSHFMTRNQDAHLNGYDDYKRSMHDACLRVPLVVTGGEFTGGGVVTDLISTAGLPKTILGIAGVDVGDKMIGEDFADVLHKTDPDRPNEVFAQISESRVGRAIRTADYAYSVYAPGINGGAQPAADLYADDFFYDLKKDPYELNNLIDDPAYTQVKQELRKKLLKWIRLAENAEPEIVDG